ncbi:MAG: hypothetical protein MH321_18625 [Leptospiraceae bacterium]|nr:hypothetical protein [Leptospiraceae bacterium]
MGIQEFDKNFQEICEAMVQVAFGLVESIEKNVESVYVYVSIEETLAYDVFYKINGKIVTKGKVNDVSKKKVDLSDDTILSMLDEGMEYVNQIDDLFKSDKREIPTQLKLVYEPKSGKFDIGISYEIFYSNHKEWMSETIFDRWVEEVKKSIE